MSLSSPSLHSEQRGNILESVYTIQLPSAPLTGHVLIFCHGYRPFGIPRQATFQSRRQTPLYDSLLSHGWIIAALSYRREDYILSDAIRDVNNLRDLIVDSYLSDPSSPIPRIVLDAQSMGGAVATLVSERFPDLYECVLAIGAALLIDEVKEMVNKAATSPEEPMIEFTYDPKIPILYIHNSSELGWVTQYVHQMVGGNDDENQRVLLRHANRPGHADTTPREILHCFAELLLFTHNWTEEEVMDLLSISGEELERFVQNTDSPFPFLKDITEFDTYPSEVTFTDDGNSAVGQIREIGHIGWLFTNFHEDDFRRLDIRCGNSFEVMVPKTGETYAFLMGEYPFVGIETGRYVATTRAYQTRFERHSIKTILDPIGDEMGVEVGDDLVVKRREVGRVKGGRVAEMIREREEAMARRNRSEISS